MTLKRIIAIAFIVLSILFCYSEYNDLKVKYEKQSKDLEFYQSTFEANKKSIDDLVSMRNTLIDEKKELQTKCSQLENQLATLQAPSQSSTSSNNSIKDNSYTVYITNTGTKYHRSWCSYLRQSSIAISLNQAINQGYTPCSRCSP